ncbi:hypothetical protein ACFU5Z_16395 [Streptomyces sp. NPDC057521]|uniref:hypothetical protein n=1 Tax=Streptomyces sp. NPDC057521 TaxID=3346156 RepID=UPI0036B73452
MNPYDANTHPGIHFVAETLGLRAVSTLTTAHRPGEPLYEAATRVIGAANDLDEAHERVTNSARKALGLLEPVARGELSSGKVAFALLRSSLPTFGEHLARESLACDQLVESLSAYQLLLREAGTEQRAAAPRVSAALSRSRTQAPPCAPADVVAGPISTTVDKPLRFR